MLEDEKSIRIRQRVGKWLMIVGGVLSVVSLSAEFLGLDITPGFGMVQMLQFLLGVSSLTLGVFVYLQILRPQDTPPSLQAEIGVRLSATGLVFAYVCGFSDLIGIGTHVTPDFERPFVGPLQFGGLVLSIGAIAIGCYLYYSSRGTRPTSSLEFLVKTQNPALPPANESSAAENESPSA